MFSCTFLSSEKGRTVATMHYYEMQQMSVKSIVLKKEMIADWCLEQFRILIWFVHAILNAFLAPRFWSQGGDVVITTLFSCQYFPISTLWLCWKQGEKGCNFTHLLGICCWCDCKYNNVFVCMCASICRLVAYMIWVCARVCASALHLYAFSKYACTCLIEHGDGYRVKCLGGWNRRTKRIDFEL